MASVSSVLVMPSHTDNKSNNTAMSSGSSSSSSSNDSNNRAKNHKSRNGCITCKKKRLKCDETKPGCLNCSKKNIECGGYSTNFKWKSFGETTTGEVKMSKVAPMPPPAITSIKLKTKSDVNSTLIRPSLSTPINSSLRTTASSTKASASTSASTAKPKPPSNSIPPPTATGIKRSLSMPESSIFEEAIQQATLSIAGKTSEELAQQSKLMAMGKNPNSRPSYPDVQQSDLNQSNEFTQPTTKRRKRTPSSNSNVSYQKQHAPSPAPAQAQAFSPGSIPGNSPSLSTLVRAFTDFDSFNIPSPSNLEPLSPNYSAKIQEIAASYSNNSLSNNFLRFNNENAIQEDEEEEEESLQPNDQKSMVSFKSGAGSPVYNSVNIKRSLSVDSAISRTSLPQYGKDLLMFSNSLSTQNTNSPLSSITSPNNGTSGHVIGNFVINSPMNMSMPSSPKIEHMMALSTLSKNNMSLSDFEKIFNAFDNYTCAIMSIKNGPNENPWRTLIWPLALQNSVLFNAVAAMSLFHVARNDEGLRRMGMSYMKQSMNELAEGLVSGSIENDVALATCLVLAVTDCWEKHTSTGFAHLKGAKSILKKMDKQSYLRNSKLYVFLINTFIYFDVLARLSNSQHLRFINSDNTDYDDSEPSPDGHQSALAESPEDHGDGSKRSDSRTSVTSNNNASTLGSIFAELSLMNKDFNLDNDLIIDPLLGCARGLFLIIGKVATFIAKIRTLTKLSLSNISNAVNLKSELESWKPDVNIKKTILEDPLCDLSSCIATAEAYRFSTLLYLQQAVPEVSSQGSNDLAEKVLMLLASIPTSSRTCNLHIFPLLIASCEMTGDEDRTWILNRWDLLREKMWIGNIDRSIDIVKEVWRRKDMVQSQQDKNDDDWDLFQTRIDALTGSKSRATEGINSWTHWSSVMKDWNWEVLFG